MWQHVSAQSKLVHSVNNMIQRPYIFVHVYSSSKIPAWFYCFKFPLRGPMLRRGHADLEGKPVGRKARALERRKLSASHVWLWMLEGLSTSECDSLGDVSGGRVWFIFHIFSNFKGASSGKWKQTQIDVQNSPIQDLFCRHGTLKSHCFPADRNADASNALAVVGVKLQIFRIFLKGCCELTLSPRKIDFRCWGLLLPRSCELQCVPWLGRKAMWTSCAGGSKLWAHPRCILSSRNGCWYIIWHVFYLISIHWIEVRI